MLNYQFLFFDEKCRFSAVKSIPICPASAHFFLAVEIIDVLFSSFLKKVFFAKNYLLKNTHKQILPLKKGEKMTAAFIE